MSDISETAYRDFVQSVIQNIKKNGFPDKKVSFPLEQLYEAASNKGINFNKVLETLDSILIGHVKTPEKIIFYPKDKMPAPVENTGFKMEDLSGMLNISPDDFKGLNIGDMMSKANEMVNNMNPEQLKSMMGMYENMTDEQKKDLMDKAKELGFKMPWS
jgi:hypothetical protein